MKLIGSIIHRTVTLFWSRLMPVMEPSTVRKFLKVSSP